MRLTRTKVFYEITSNLNGIANAPDVSTTTLLLLQAKHIVKTNPSNAMRFFFFYLIQISFLCEMLLISQLGRRSHIRVYRSTVLHNYFIQLTIGYICIISDVMFVMWFIKRTTVTYCHWNIVGWIIRIMIIIWHMG